MSSLLAATVLATAVASSLATPTAASPASGAAEQPRDGAICIAPFKVDASAPGQPPSVSEPNMSQTTWAPSRDSVYRFHVDGRLAATVRAGAMAVVRDLPTHRRVRVRVTLDGRPYETFSLDVGKAADRRICLWLYPGYWHWIDNGWSGALGCKCDC